MSGWARRIPQGVGVALGFAGMLALGLTLVVRSGALIDRARFAHPDDARMVVDRHGEVLRRARVDGADRRWVRLGELSPHLVHAVIAAEDGDFYEHAGVDGRAVARAVARNLLPWSRRSGASTITQQLVKRVYGREPGLWAKGVEALRALSLERAMSKDEILEQYVNRLPFGDGIEGVGRACEEYFGRECNSLSAAEAALLAGIPQAPSATEPRRHLPRALARRAVVLARMEARGFLDARAHALALAEVPAIADVPARAYEAPRFVDAVLREGAAGFSPAGRVVTALDLGLERQVEAALAAGAQRFAGRGARNGAAVVVANATGEVLAYAGAAVPTEGAAGGALDLLRARRQPGSALKPFAYELWFERGGTAAGVLDDVARAMTGAAGASFEARDYDGAERGPVRARVALASSLNLAALDVARRVGPDALLARLRALGLGLPSGVDRYGAGVVLGNAEVTALDLARAYVTLARGGTSVPLSLRPAGAVAGAPVMRPEAARVAWDVLADPAARRAAFGDDLESLTGGQHFALKTGTSSGWRDAWAAAADERVTVVVWFGDPGGGAMAGVSGFEAAAPVAARILGAATEIAARDGLPAATRPPVVLTDVAVCPWSGLRAGPHCGHAVVEHFAPGTAPRERCDAHEPDGRYRLPVRYRAWAERARPGGAVVANAAAGEGGAHGALAVRWPRDGARLLMRAGAGVTFALRAARDGEEIDARWEVDGAALPGAAWRATPGEHSVVARSGGAASPPSRVFVASIGSDP